jgi:hypothetical protein
MRNRGKLVLTALTVMAAFAALLVGAVGRSSATVPSNFVSPVHVATTFEGCKNTGGVPYPSGGPFVCADAAYTSGNLGKGWNELDLVPFYVNFSVGNQSDATTDFNLIVAGDYKLGTATGWDVVGAPSIHSGSDASCSVSANAQDIGPGITGGADSSIYRVWTVHLAKGASCRVDYYMRLALGSHLYSGSSLQSYIFGTSDFSTGKSTIPLPVNEIEAQSVSKDMTATQDTSTPWNVTKSPTPNTVHFGDICSATFANTANVSVQVSWTKEAAVPNGDVLLTTNVYATNPAARTITTTVSDQMYAGSDQSTPLGSPFVATKDVPANTANYLLETDTQTVPASSVTHYNDIATATYTDAVTGVPVPGDTTASAGSDITTGSNLNSNATVTDAESISGSDLSFKVNSRSGSPTGSYTNGYTQGNYVNGGTTPSEVDWSSGANAISSTGSITFSKTIKLDPAAATTGSLSDTATLNGSDGFGPVSATASIGIDSSETSTLTITKNLSQAVSSDQTFHFDVLDASNTVVASNVAVTVAAGHTSGSAQVSGLALGSYTVHEDTPPSGWTGSPDQPVTLSGCTGSVSFTDQLNPAIAFANKVTDPAGYEQGWTFTLTRPDNSTLTGTTDSGGSVIWTGGSTNQAPLALEGTYTISETQQTAWNETSAAAALGSTGSVSGGTGAGASCSFTVAYPADAGLLYGCTITNQSRAHVHVNKTFEGNPLTGSEAFTFQLRDGSSAADAGTILETEIADVADNGTATFAYDLIPGHTYAICEVLQTNVNSSLTGYNPNGDTGVVCQDFTPTPGQSVEFNVDNTPVPATAQVKKVTDPAGYEAGWVMTLDGPGTPAGGETVTTTGTGFIPFTTQLQDGGSYTITETSQTGWTQTDASTECSFTVHYPADAGRTFSCTITNQSRAHVKVNKTFEGSALTGNESFVFQLRSGADAGHAGTTIESQTLAVGNDPATFAADLIPGQTYQMCEVLQSNIDSSLSGEAGSFNPNGDTGVVCIDFTPTPGQLVSITVDNTPVPATAQVKKVTIPAGSEAGWDMTLNGPGTPAGGETVTTTGTGFIPFTTELQDGGSYTITETPKTGWDQTGTSTECSFTVSYPADANRTFSCTITNTERGTIIVKKVTDPSPDPSSSQFTFTGDAAGSIGDGGNITVNDLVPGNYSSTETALAGWSLQSVSCDDGSSANPSSGSVATATASFKLDPGETVTCTFTNKSRGHVRVIKTLNGAPLTASSQQFTFELRLGDQAAHSTAALETLTTNGTNLGTLNFQTALVPGQTYAMCELLVAGYGPNISGGYGPYNPSDNPNYFCWNFQITVAEVAAGDPALTFNVDNSHATAKGLTIGYWKNHAASDCKKSKGKQTDVLGQYLDGITLGTITFHDPTVSGSPTECNAVQTLSKNTFSGVNKASDPLFNMAAQLLAADLNVKTGDIPSSTVAATITAAQALLVKYGWNGQTYNGPLSSADAALANSYNTILDQFNNNQI